MNSSLHLAQQIGACKAFKKNKTLGSDAITITTLLNLLEQGTEYLIQTYNKPGPNETFCRTVIYLGVFLSSSLERILVTSAP